MVDALTQMRRPYHPEAPYEEVVEDSATKILCVFVPIKPREYVDTMQRFRILFKGIADSPWLQATFANSVLPAALTAGEQLEYIPSLYFSWDPILSRGNLQKANLHGLELYRANLRGTDLQEVRGLTQEQLEQAVGDENTVLPEYLSVPAAWWS
jgi:hypothetical protein